MKLYCLSNDPNKPCSVLSFNELTVMLDCGLSSQTVLNFLPMPLVPNARLSNLPTWNSRDLGESQLEGELKECCGKVFVDSQPEFSPPLENLIDFSQVDVILISNYMCMLALPFITEGTGFNGIVYATEPTLQIGRFYLEELVEFITQSPKSSYATQWKNLLHVLPPPLADSLRPKSWRHIYSMTAVNSSLSRVQMVGYDEKLDVYGGLQVIPVSSGYCLGSSNWIISTEHEKIAYISGSSTLTTHPRPMDQGSLKNADILIMTGLTQTPLSNPDAMLGLLCMTVAMTLRSGGSVLIPCYPSGVVYDLFECLSSNLDSAGMTSIPMYFISPVADSSLAYSNILAEWLSTAKQNKVYLPEEPFPHAFLVKNARLKQFKHIYSDGFSTDFRQPSVVFCGHPSLRFGDSVHFIEMWGNNPQNVVIFTEPDFDHTEAVAPFQPLAMKICHCPIDTSLNFTQANKLIRDLKPGALVVPHCYTTAPVNAPTRTDLVIDCLDRPVLTFKRGEVLTLPIKRKKSRVYIEPQVASKLLLREIKSGVNLCSVTGHLDVKDNLINIGTIKVQGGEKDDVTFQNSSDIKHEFGSLDVNDFVQRLAQEGIKDVKVEPGPSGIIIHLPDEDTLIQVDDHSTHIFCEGEPEQRMLLRNTLLKCLKNF